MKRLILFFIDIYQKTISPDHGPIRLLFPGEGPIVCRYHPTCSDYTKDAVILYGAWKGSILGMRRILRCHPWSTHPIHDPVV
jgi:uncharacterized protein